MFFKFDLRIALRPTEKDKLIRNTKKFIS